MLTDCQQLPSLFMFGGQRACPCIGRVAAIVRLVLACHFKIQILVLILNSHPLLVYRPACYKGRKANAKDSSKS
jgi:hypothetical protein